jgi:hypothetical protein
MYEGATLPALHTRSPKNGDKTVILPSGLCAAGVLSLAFVRSLSANPRKPAKSSKKIYNRLKRLLTAIDRGAGRYLTLMPPRRSRLLEQPEENGTCPEKHLERTPQTLEINLGATV